MTSGLNYGVKYTQTPTGTEIPTVVIPNTDIQISVRYSGYTYDPNNDNSYTYEPFFELTTNTPSLKKHIIIFNQDTYERYEYLYDYLRENEKYGFFLTATSSKNDQTNLTYDQRGIYWLKSPGVRNITGPVDTFYVYIYRFPTLGIAHSGFQSPLFGQKIKDYLLKIEKMEVNVYETIQNINYYDERRMDRDCIAFNPKNGDKIVSLWRPETSLRCISCNKKINPNGVDRALISQSACYNMIQYNDYKIRCSATDNGKGKYFTFTGSDQVKRCFQCSSSVFTGQGEFIGPVDMNYCQSIYHGP